MRQAIIETAVTLFAERGYGRTTLAEITAAVEIAPATFFNYFPRKDAIVFALTDQLIVSASARIGGRPESESTAQAIASWMSDEVAGIIGPYAEFLPLLPLIVMSDPDLLEGQRLRLARIEDLLAAGFARDLGEEPNSIRPCVLGVIARRAIIDDPHCWHRQTPGADLASLLRLRASHVQQALETAILTVAELPGAPAARAVVAPTRSG
jgi:AcrR family transcriptional regulator